MNDRFLVSIVIPIYNVEPYLKKCLDSVCNQTYKNLEILLINDGSTDDCELICKEFESIDIRIKYFYKENGGLSSARNHGIDNATGDYIMFIDSDDFIETNMVEALLKEVIKETADIAICNYYNFYEDKTVINRVSKKKLVVSDDSKYDYLYNEFYLITTVAWNKLYKREIFSNLRYPNGKINEDEFIIYDILKNANRIVYNTNLILYYYVKRDNSIMNTLTPKVFHSIEAMEFRISRLSDYNLINKTKYREIDAIINVFSRTNINTLDKSVLKKYKKKAKNIAKELRKNRAFTGKKRIKLLFVIYFFDFIVLNRKRKVKQFEKSLLN